MHVIFKLKPGHRFCQIEKQRKSALACLLGKRTHTMCMHVHPETRPVHRLRRPAMQCMFLFPKPCSTLKSTLIWTEEYSLQKRQPYQHDNMECRSWPIIPIAITSSGRASIIPSHRASKCHSSPHPFCAQYRRGQMRRKISSRDYRLSRSLPP
jgi:hypothetical protein